MRVIALNIRQTEGSRLLESLRGKTKPGEHQPKLSSTSPSFAPEHWQLSPASSSASSPGLCFPFTRRLAPSNLQTDRERLAWIASPLLAFAPQPPMLNKCTK